MDGLTDLNGDGVINELDLQLINTSSATHQHLINELDLQLKFQMDGALTAAFGNVSYFHGGLTALVGEPNDVRK